MHHIQEINIIILILQILGLVRPIQQKITCLSKWQGKALCCIEEHNRKKIWRHLFWCIRNTNQILKRWWIGSRRVKPKKKVKASKKRIYIGYNQILEKVKDRQRFWNAPPCGIRKKKWKNDMWAFWFIKRDLWRFTIESVNSIKTKHWFS